MLEEALLNYGAIGIFCAYLIWHDRKVNDSVVATLQQMTRILIEVKCDVDNLKKVTYGARQKNFRSPKGRK